MASRKKESMSDGEELHPKPNISAIKNKQLRQEMYRKMKMEKKKTKLKEKKMKMKEAKESGVKVVKQVPKTIESMRVPDETMVNPEDEEVQLDNAMDEMATYFNRETTPKILLTTCDRPGPRTNKFCKEIKKLLPNTTLLYRRGLDLKKVIPQALAREYTDLIVINEDRHSPNGLVLTHLPDGPTAHFKLSNVRLTTEIKNAGELTGHKPEVILNNFNTRLGHSVGRMLASIFPYDPNFHGRRVVTFHNQRDFIFFRHHRIANSLDPDGTPHSVGVSSGSKLFAKAFKIWFQRSKGTYSKRLEGWLTGAGATIHPEATDSTEGKLDSKYGEYEFVHKRHEMDSSRRKFHL